MIDARQLVVPALVMLSSVLKTDEKCRGVIWPRSSAMVE